MPCKYKKQDVFDEKLYIHPIHELIAIPCGDNTVTYRDNAVTCKDNIVPSRDNLLEFQRKANNTC